MKKLLLTAILSVSTIFGASQAQTEVTSISDYGAQFISTNSCVKPNYEKDLESNETTLFYMYSNDEGMYFLDPLAEYENVIFVGHDDYKAIPELEIDIAELHHGQKFVGVFDDEALWELIGLYEMEEK